jgi:O-antigen ligase
MTHTHPQTLSPWATRIPLIVLAIGFLSIPFSPTLNSLILITGLWCVINPALRQELIFFIKQPAFFWGCAFYIWMMVRMIGGDPIHHHDKIHFFLHYVNMFLPIFLLPPLIKNKSTQQLMYLCVIISTLCISVLIWLNNLDLSASIRSYYFSQKWIADPEIEPLSVLYVIAIYLTCLLTLEYKKNKLWLGLGVALILWFTYFIFAVQIERVGPACYLIVMTYFLFQKLRLKNVLIVLATVVIAIIALFHWEKKHINPKFVETYEKIHESIFHPARLPSSTAPDIRIYWYEKGWALFKVKPWIGYGTGTFNGGDYVYVGIGPDPTFAGHHVTPENNYLAIMLSLGSIGLFFFGLYLWYIWKITGKLSLENAMYAHGILIIIMCASISYPAFILNISSITCAGLLGVTLGQLRKNN